MGPAERVELLDRGLDDVAVDVELGIARSGVGAGAVDVG
jgi:hypothetical protein